MYFRRAGATLPAMLAGLLALDASTEYDVTMHHGFGADGPAVTHNAAELSALGIALEPGESLLLRYAAK